MEVFSYVVDYVTRYCDMINFNIKDCFMPRKPNYPLPKPHCPYCKTENPRLKSVSHPPYSVNRYRFLCQNCKLTSSYYNNFQKNNTNSVNRYKYLKLSNATTNRTSDYVSYGKWQEWASKYYTESNFRKPTKEFDNDEYRDRCRVYNKLHNNIDL